MAYRFNSRHQKIFKLTMLAMLTALVVVLQLTGTAVKIGGTSVSLTLIPIVLGAMILGPAGGAWLGFMFGFITYVVGGVLGADTFTFILFTNNPVITAFICFGKAICAGLAAGLIYRALLKRNSVAATFAAAAVAPIVNTGIFILGGLLLTETLKTNFVEEGKTVIYFLVFVCAGTNFIFEFLLNMVVAPALNMIMMHLGLIPKNQKAN